VESTLLAQLQAIDTCTVANAIEELGDRLRNEGFTNPSIRRMTASPTPLVGHAVTVKIHCSRPPMRARAYVDHTDWWQYILTLPAPRVVVIQDVDIDPGRGTFLGEIHAAILQALGCVGGITDGSVRDVPAVQKSGFQLFAGSMAVSHAYAHITEFGTPVEIGGLAVNPGDLVHGDLHGVLTIPSEIAASVPLVAGKIRAHEQQIIALCQAADFSLEKLRQLVGAVS
jgi:regulator of RNase E activity RraA